MCADNRKKILVTGGAIGDIPIINQARKMGLEVFTTGNRSHDPGHSFSDRYIEADYKNELELIQIIRNFAINFIVPSCHDTAYISASKVAKSCGLPGFDEPDISEMIHHKHSLANGLLDAGVPNIKTEIINEFEDALKLFKNFGERVVIKPVDMTGGRGVTFVSKETELLPAINKAREESLNKKILIQEYIVGSEHGFTGILHNTRIGFYFFDDEYRFLNRYRVAGTYSPSSVDLNSKNLLINFINQFAQTFNLVNGLIHVQFIMTTGVPRILEICRRPPGDFYPYFVDFASKINYTEKIIQGFMGQDISFQDTNYDKNKIIFRHVVMANRNGIFREIKIDHKILKSTLMIHEFKQKGDVIKDFLTETIAVVIFEASAFEKKEFLNEIQKIIYPIIDDN